MDRRSKNKKRLQKELKLKKKYKIRMILFLLVMFSVLILCMIYSIKRDKREMIEAEIARIAEAQKKVFDYDNALRGLTLYDKDSHSISSERADELLADFASCYGIDEKSYTKEVRNLLMNHFEARDFVFDYPIKKGKATASDANPSAYDYIEFKKEVPHLYQWDTRWGYKMYGSDAMGITGCGPTALSMVALYILKNKKYTPDYIADFAIEEGYAVEGSGTSWSLMSEGAESLGILSIDVSPVEDEMAAQLLAGRPLICIMGKGHFTSNGHFIVITGYEVGDTTDGIYTNGKFIVNDPNCVENSNKKWTYEEIQNEIGKIWAYTKP